LSVVEHENLVIASTFSYPFIW